ncbi:hypothetical protein RQP46_010869 [Phenoliferia psychrophenolica]
MSATPDEGSSQEHPSLATLLPGELIEAVLDYLEPPAWLPNHREWIEPEDLETKSNELKVLESCSLICRAWREPAQRRVFKRLVIHSSAQADRIIEGFAATGLKDHVRILRVETWGNPLEDGYETTEFAGVSTVQISSLLVLLSNVRTLWTEPLPTNERGYTTLQSTAPFPLLTSLVIKTEPFHLPRLTHLGVLGEIFPAQLTEIALLAPETFRQITHLTWEDYDMEIPDERLLSLVGPSLHTLIYSTECEERDIGAILAVCPVLEVLSLHTRNLCETTLSDLPSTLRVVTLHDIFEAHNLLDELTAATRPAALQMIILSGWLDRPEDFDTEEDYNLTKSNERESLKEIIELCERGQVELVVEGDEMPQLLEELE